MIVVTNVTDPKDYEYLLGYLTCGFGVHILRKIMVITKVIDLQGFEYLLTENIYVNV